MLKQVHASWYVSDADMVIQYWMPSLECMAKVVADPEWAGKAVKDQDQWLDMTRCEAHVCHETVYLEDGKSMNV